MCSSKVFFPGESELRQGSPRASIFSLRSFSVHATALTALHSSSRHFYQLKDYQMTRTRNSTAHISTSKKRNALLAQAGPAPRHTSQPWPEPLTASDLQRSLQNSPRLRAACANDVGWCFADQFVQIRSKRLLGFAGRRSPLCFHCHSSRGL
uniref:Uncharacterized protein n=1 Tax=Mycena chlorophos TaxID=658473 RepID=A0ABQ0L2A3_MYCCL|nr:predicted protein [Mycena chlorophos]